MFPIISCVYFIFQIRSNTNSLIKKSVYIKTKKYFIGAKRRCQCPIFNYVLIRISKVFNVSTDYLLGLEPKNRIDLSGLSQEETDAVFLSLKNQSI